MEFIIKAIKYLVIAAIAVLGARIAYVAATTFDKSYYCVGKEKVFQPNVFNMKYVAFDAPNPSETHNLEFVLHVNHTSRWFTDESVWFNGDRMVFSTYTESVVSLYKTNAYYNRATKTYVGHTLDNKNNNNSAEFSPISKKFVSTEAFYKDGGGAYQTRLTADIFKVAEAQCAPY